MCRHLSTMPPRWGGHHTLFYAYPIIQPRWAQFLQLMANTTFNLRPSPLLVNEILMTIYQHQRSPVTLVLLAEFPHSLWLDRNHVVFRLGHNFTPWTHIFQSASTHTQYIINHTYFPVKLRRLQQDHQKFLNRLDTLNSWSVLLLCT